MEEKKLSFKTRLSYSFGDLACNILFAATANMASYFYTNIVGMSAAVVGTILLLSRMFDGFSDAIMGVIVDRSKSTYGKARVWVLRMIIPFGAAAVLMFMVPAHASAMAQAIYVFITYNFAVTIVYTALNLPYGAMAVLMTTSQNERTVLNMYRMCIAPIGAVVVTAFTLPMANRLGGDQRAWIMISIGYAIISMILLFICFLNCKEQVSEDPTEVADTAVPVGKSIGALFKNRYWLIIAGVFILWGMYFSLNGMMVSYYAQYALGNNERVTLLTLAEKIPLILSVVLVAPFVKKLGKRNCSIAGSVLFLAGAAIMAAQPYNLTTLTVGLIVRGLGGGTVGALIYGLLADTVEYGHWYTGIRNEGLCYCASAVGYKLGGGLTNAVCGFVMSHAGFDRLAASVPESAVAAIQNLYLMVPFIAWGGIAVLLFFYHLDKEYAYVESELAEGRWRLGSTRQEAAEL